MQTKQTIPLYSFYRWDDTLFELLDVPEGVDKDKLIDNILLEAGERSVIYSDPEFLKAAIGIWSNTYQATFERWANALAIEYDPLENYDRREEWTDDSTHPKPGPGSHTLIMPGMTLKRLLTVAA